MYIVGESVDGVNYTYSRGTDLLGYTSSLGETVYYRTNVHGDVKELVNVFGESLERYDYNAYGAEDEDYNPFRRMFGKKNVHNPFRYTGEYTDSETGLVYLRNRMYDPETGRFISEDPAKDGLNWYAYCEGNPITKVDPWGLFRIIDGEAYDRYQLGSGNPNNEINDYISEDIKKMQVKLQKLGYLDESIQTYGYFGEKTLAAVNAFRADNGIENNTSETNGIVGATTWASLGLDFDVMETCGQTKTNITMSRGVLRVDRNIANANIVSLNYVADAVKKAYKVAFGEEFNVTTESVYWEIAGHIFADKFAKENSGGMLNSFWERVQKSTGVIDIGDNVIVPDNNRWLWDWISTMGK